jgi:hypothetical protein
MLTLNVVPERSLGCEQWEFIVGGFPFFVIIFIAPILFVAILSRGATRHSTMHPNYFTLRDVIGPDDLQIV